VLERLGGGRHLPQPLEEQPEQQRDADGERDDDDDGAAHGSELLGIDTAHEHEPRRLVLDDHEPAYIWRGGTFTGSALALWA
jgi:hypothetical protein